MAAQREAMDTDYETPQPDPAIYHEYIEPIGYDSVNVTSLSRDSQYEQLPPDDTPVAA